MTQTEPIRMLAVSASMHRASVTRTVMEFVAERLRQQGCFVDVLDLSSEPLPLFNPDTSFDADYYQDLRRRVVGADVFILGTPDYHGSMSSALKNFLDHFWKEFSGKLFSSVVASHEKGLTVTDHIRTVARQCYAWSMPYGVSFMEKEDVQGGEILSASFRSRLEMFTRDVRVYGEVLSKQRQADLAGTDPGFLARLR